MSLHDMIREDVGKVFMDSKGGFADEVKVRYCGTVYDIHAIITDGDRGDSKATANGHTASRKQINSDNMAGLIQTSRVMHASIEEFGGRLLERFQKLEFLRDDGYIDPYYIVACEEQRGIMRVALGAFGE